MLFVESLIRLFVNSVIWLFGKFVLIRAIRVFLSFDIMTLRLSTFFFNRKVRKGLRKVRKGFFTTKGI